MSSFTADFCRSCPERNINDPPNCIITQIIQGCSIDTLFSKNKQKTDVLICPNFAEDFINGKLIISNKCVACELCYICCSKKQAIPTLNTNLENLILSDLNKLNVYYKTIFKDCTIGSEIQVSGRSRSKRIDLVICSNKMIYLIKTLSNIDRIKFYSRSYDETIEPLKLKFPEKNFSKIILIPQYSNSFENEEEGILTIKTFNKILSE